MDASNNAWRKAIRAVLHTRESQRHRPLFRHQFQAMNSRGDGQGNTADLNAEVVHGSRSVLEIKAFVLTQPGTTLAEDKGTYRCSAPRSGIGLGSFY